MIKRTAGSFVVLGSLLIVCVTAMNACNTAPMKTYQKNRSHQGVTDASIAQGEALAARYCQSCHLLPLPDLLDATSWDKGVLPQMGPRLGIFEYRYQHYPNNSQDPNVGRGFYPAQPMLSEEEWGAVIDYYTALAPDTLPSQQRKEALRPGADAFVLEMPGAGARPMGVGATPPATCLVRYDSALHEVFTSDIIRHSFDRWDGRLNPLPGADISGAVVDLVREKSGWVACNIGVMAPNNAKAGHIDRFEVPGGTAGVGQIAGAAGTPLVSGLMRPVNMASADLNGDGREDLVVCEFGFIKGELAWLENKGGGSYEKHVLRSIPGAIRVVVQDYNHDGLPDLWVLFAQGDEAIFLYTNKGKGQFEEWRLLSFPPSYGSTYFELDDFNKDGHPDILYTCGDNGDFSTILKPYHGVYIFRNDGHEHFTQQYFYPINGCYRAMARDFDGDGDLDIASIAWFADFRRQPEEGFVYLENRGNEQFSPRTVPGTECGRWITMDIADTDGDGKPDILLANCSVGPGFLPSATNWKKGPPFIVLRNRIR
jgi:hypothetical protein